LGLCGLALNVEPSGTASHAKSPKPYSGRNPFNRSTDLQNLNQGPRELVNLLFDQPVALVDLKNIPDERLKEWGHMAVYLLPLKHAFDTMPFQEIFNHGIHGPHGMLLSSGFHGFI
jgi:hypothetical protein